MEQSSGQDHTHLTLVDLTRQAGTPSWMEPLRGIAEKCSSVTMTRLADTQVALEEDLDRVAVIAYLTPSLHVAESLRKGVDPAEAILDWREFAKDLLDLHRNYWDRLVMVDTPVSEVEFRDLVDRLRSSFQLAVKQREYSWKPVAHEVDDRETVDLRIAAKQLLSLKPARKLEGELASVSLPKAHMSFVPAEVSDLMRLRDSRIGFENEIKRLSSEKMEARIRLESCTKENKQIVRQLHKTQEELEKYISRVGSKNQRIDNLQKGRSYRKLRIGELETELEDAKRESSELRAGLDRSESKQEWLRAARDHHRAAARNLRAELKDHAKQDKAKSRALALRDAELQKIKSSRSWRYTRILRKNRFLNRKT